MGAGANPLAAMPGADTHKALKAEQAVLEMVGSCLMHAFCHMKAYSILMRRQKLFLQAAL